MYRYIITFWYLVLARIVRNISHAMSLSQRHIYYHIIIMSIAYRVRTVIYYTARDFSTTLKHSRKSIKCITLWSFSTHSGMFKKKIIRHYYVRLFLNVYFYSIFL